MILREGQILFDVSDSQSLERPAPAKHPFWSLEGEQLRNGRVPLCVAVLLCAGLLCSAGGIGGGGIYVTVLMVAGGLSIVDAVPLSKAVVFLGSLSSLVLNARKSFRAQGRAQTLIDYNVCRLVVPWSLIGTYLGVLLNRWLPGWVILVVLTAILVAITATVTRATLAQYTEEQARDCEEVSSSPLVPTGKNGDGAGLCQPLVAAAGSSAESCDINGDHLTVVANECKAEKLRDALTTTDTCLASAMLFAVITFSVVRYHAGQCRSASYQDRYAACHHPAVFWLPFSLESLMEDSNLATPVVVLAFVLPLSMCTLVALCWARSLVAAEGWRPTDVAKFSGMAVVTGCLAGLVGIGGGLIFSPFFLLMGLEPSIAVATSSTCVIFTSSSTTLQYLLTDRIILSLSLVYGLTNLLASYVGTRFVHYLQDVYGTRKSLISAIVAAGVLISTALSVLRLVEGIRDGFQVDVH